MTAISVRGAGSPASAITYRIGGREYPLKTQRNCKVCMSPHRFDIEEALVGGRTYRKIVESLPDDGHGLSSENVKNHYLNGHLPTEHSATRQIVEARAQRVGKAVEDSIEQLVDGVSLAQVVVQKTFEAIAANEILPDMKDGLAAAKFLADLGEYDEGGTDMAAVSEAFMAYHDTAQEVMTPEQFSAFGRMLSSHPVLKALAAKYDGEAASESAPEEPTRGEVLAYHDESADLPAEDPAAEQEPDATEPADDEHDPAEDVTHEADDEHVDAVDEEDDDEGWEEVPEED